MSWELNASAVKARIAQIRNNAPRALLAAGQFIVIDAQKRIAAGGDGWPAWSPAYAKRVKGKHQMLWDKGTLMRSLVIKSATGEIVQFGSNLVYAHRQQYGGGGIPSRPYFMLQNEDVQQDAINIFKRTLLQGI